MWQELPQEAAEKQSPEVPENMYPNATVTALESC
jgi:hypothetical protein